MKIILSCDFLKGSGNPGFFDLGMAFIAGLERLGHEVYWVAEVTPGQCLDSGNHQVEFEDWQGIQRFEALAKSYRIWPRCCLIHTQPLLTCGMTFHEILKAASTAQLLLIIGGKVQTPIILEHVPCTAYVEVDPANPGARRFEHGVDPDFKYYDHFFTVALNTGTPRCEVPTGGLPWQGLFQPVVLDRWLPSTNGNGGRFTTISNGVEGKEVTLEGPGWRLSDLRQFQGVEDYRRFIGSSRAGLSLAEDHCVKARTGWFSDVTARYLAMGKPALVQSTGFEDHLPTGRGLLSFRTLEEAAEGIEEINRDYCAHCLAARQIAEEYFDSTLVLSKLLDEIFACVRS